MKIVQRGKTRKKADTPKGDLAHCLAHQNKERFLEISIFTIRVAKDLSNRDSLERKEEGRSPILSSATVIYQ